MVKNEQNIFNYNNQVKVRFRLYVFKSEHILIWIDNAHDSKTKNLVNKNIFPENTNRETMQTQTEMMAF